MCSLCCNGCGSDLQVTDDVRFLTCNYCHSKLEVVRDVSATHTQVLEKIEQTTDRIAGNLKVIELQNDLERLDREWESLRQSMLVRAEHGSVSEPSAGGVIVVGLIGIVTGAVWTTLIGAFAIGFGSHLLGVFASLGLFIIAISVWSLVVGPRRARQFKMAWERHQRQRRQLLARIASEPLR